MENFILRDINSDLEKELENIGFDKSYLHKAVDKYKYKNIKIFDLSIPQANILKQTAISVGADCAVHRETITCKINKTNCILGGSFSQLRKIAQKLKQQPFKLSALAELIERNLNFKISPIQIGEHIFDFSKPYIAGVLNITKDSFSDGGEFFDFENTIKHLQELINDGADIVELGAESTRPFSDGVNCDDQITKLLPVINFVKNNNINIPLSIDTRSAKVAQACLDAGADIINDVSGLEHDADLVKIIAKYGCPIIIQHSKGSPKTMQINPTYTNLIDEIFFNLKEKIDFAIANGIKYENIIIDPGIGFGKTKEQNFEILNKFDELFSLKCPIMIGLSRKSLLNMGNESNDTKDIFTLALNSILINKKINFIRVHNVKLHKTLLRQL